MNPNGGKKQDEPTDAWLELQASKGEARLRNNTDNAWLVGSLPAVEPPWVGKEADFIQRQEKAFGVELQRTQLELLRRASHLVDYLDTNVGLTDEYPVMLLGEDESSERQLTKLIADLRGLVGCLTEVE